MRVHDLSGRTLAELTEVFNLSFSGYFVPLTLTEQQLKDKILSENIQLEYSVGVSVNQKLVAFVWIGIDKKNELAISYNAGTGVIPEFRGLGLTKKMYAFLLPLLQLQGIQQHWLEVISQNSRALQLYEQLGYERMRTLSCFQGRVALPDVMTGLDFRKIDLEDEHETQAFRNHTPAYQNALSCVRRNKDVHETIAVFEGKKWVAYAVYVKNSTRIKQFGVHQDYRKKGIGHQLFYEIQKNNTTQDVVLINIDKADSGTLAFLKKIGLQPFLEQYEMVLHKKNETVG